MRRMKATRSVVAARAAILGLLMSAGAGCADDGGPPSSGAGRANDAGDTGEGGAGNAGGTSGSGAASGNGQGGGGRHPGDPDEPCFSNADCDDLEFCNGEELCVPKFPGADVRVCMRPLLGPCGNSYCDEATDECDCANADADGDGYKAPGCAHGDTEDCDDGDGLRNPAVKEVCDPSDPDSFDRDEDCDPTTFGPDADEDGYFRKGCSNLQAYQPVVLTDGPLINAGNDCEDDQKAIHPGATEVCDNHDNDCNGQRDDVSGPPTKDDHKFYRDRDGDLFGETSDYFISRCAIPPDGYALLDKDCDDGNPRISPAGSEICNGKDDNCDGTPDNSIADGGLLFDEPFDGVTDFECQGEDGWHVEGCPADRFDCNDDYHDACETVVTTLCNCHACGKRCDFSCGETGCEEIFALSTGGFHTCALMRSDEADPGVGTGVACWGRNADGQLGNGTAKDSAAPVRVQDLSDVTGLSSGNLHTCAVSAGEVYCWGNDEHGQLGAGPTNPYVPFPLETRALFGTTLAKQVVSGEYHSCAIYDQGTLGCWGDSEYGQLGNGTSGADELSDQPTSVWRESDEENPISDASQVAAGAQHTCAVVSGGHVECWGDNSAGQLGQDPGLLSLARFALPVPGLDGIVVQEIRAAGFHTCARAGGDVYCWGTNVHDELADPSLVWSPPIRIDLGFGATAIAVGRFFACALGDTNGVYCWGTNLYGERGSAAPNPGVAPTRVPLDDVAGLFGGHGFHVCALLEAGGARCWGRNHFGQLGTQATPEPQPTPVSVRALTGSRDCDP